MSSHSSLCFYSDHNSDNYITEEGNMLESFTSPNTYLHEEFDEVDREYRDEKENWGSNFRKRLSSNGVRNHHAPLCNRSESPASTGHRKRSSFEKYSNCTTFICTPRTPLSDITSEINTPKCRIPFRKQINFNSSTHASGMKTLRNMR
uniref:Uncharacterized protein n=1 Tax=Corethron hystrix TaxID=216773 RepID=A0A7S1FPQ0_9STRA|mmetsp:Transcript_21176/g.48077  ORF Transcript_21176/g.48077 Transcript_21176/m.48077 type:complete len:148 (+) Transcript_21176:114-557(+)